MPSRKLGTRRGPLKDGRRARRAALEAETAVSRRTRRSTRARTAGRGSQLTSAQIAKVVSVRPFVSLCLQRTAHALPSGDGMESRIQTLRVAVVSQPPAIAVFPAGHATETVWLTFWLSGAPVACTTSRSERPGTPSSPCSPAGPGRP